MVAKFLTFFGLVAAATAIAIPVAPVAHHAKVVYAEPEAPAHYQYSYSVQDSHSGDIKQQQEQRDGDTVHGAYSLVQPDGVQRIVEYTADKINGFNAIVRYEGSPVQHAAKVAVAAPAYAHAPVAKVAYAPAPVAKIAYAPAPVQNYAYSHAPVQNYAYAHAPVQNYAYAHAPAAKVAYAPAPIAKVAYAAPAQVAYAQAPAHHSYAQPQLAYAQPQLAKVAYTHNLGQVSFSSPAVSYHH